MNPIPPRFYRVQHNGSYTIFDHADGFESRGHYQMAYAFWLNKDEPTPFISVFDNLGRLFTRSAKSKCTPLLILLVFAGDANERALLLRRRNTGVFVAEIDTSSLQGAILDIQSAVGVIRLPVWVNEKSGITFVSTSAVRTHLEVKLSVSQRSEWFALDHIPYSMIRGIRNY
ncbi:hypothetical protein P168DRAFT_284037 [Aspergillus campestris IBT 28561]|uniref:Uncharacterized protein n=1 Tax=Aspergillus campestris (strain IBT 28561) TaxID=1392248 RepID=A0A2I1CXG2_ASPC2|nr:uncharacterized protein P168DRAFT_284037 [Aspergillus campestris IBT 28561]PKY02316.1 hypothetical protein P168DRAFT_284037 [Aspergillus campestris IBT 28561]